MPLLDEELAEDARYCGVCRAVRARRKAMKRSPETSPQEVNAYYAPRIAAEQARRRAAGLPEGGRTSRDLHGPRESVPDVQVRGCPRAGARPATASTPAQAREGSEGASRAVSARTLPGQAQGRSEGASSVPPPPPAEGERSQTGAKPVSQSCSERRPLIMCGESQRPETGRSRAAGAASFHGRMPGFGGSRPFARPGP